MSYNTVGDIPIEERDSNFGQLDVFLERYVEISVFVAEIYLVQ